MVKASNAPLQIRLTEPVIFLRGPSTGTDFRGRPQQTQDGPPAMVRGLLTLRLQKPTRIRTVSATLEGKAKTEWPEGAFRMLKAMLTAQVSVPAGPRRSRNTRFFPRLPRSSPLLEDIARQ